MRFLIQLAAFFLVVYLLRRFLAGFIKSGRKTTSAPEAPNRMVKDPVCGMYMDSRLAITLENRDEVVHFCSEECKKKYINKSDDGGIGRAAAG